MAAAAALALLGPLPAPDARQIEPARRRAVIVGIDRYAVAGAEGTARLADLRGAVADAMAMYETLRVSHGFAAEDIDLLLAPASGATAADLPFSYSEPTRAAILDAIERRLLPSGPGDVAFFYFAGHGSRVFNRATDEDDGLDETLVPGDSAAGAPDIRDKELRRLWNRVLDAGADLTVMVDACYSGSVSRGYAAQRFRSRSVPASSAAVEDPPPYGPIPSQRQPAALVISASLESQVAVDGSGDQDAAAAELGFTGAFLQALRMDPGAPASAVVRRAAAILQAASGVAQQPLIEGGEDGRSFLGGATGSPAGPLMVVSAAGVEPGSVQIDAGRASGLREGAQLACQRGSRLAVMHAGLARSVARALDGALPPVAGEACRVERWATATADGLPVWIGDAATGPEPLEDAVVALRTLEHAHPEWLLPGQDPTAATPTHIVRWRGGRWWGGRACAADSACAQRDLGARLEAGALIELMADDARPALFVDFPATATLAGAIAADRALADGMIVRVADPRSAVYRLTGRLGDAGLEYSWVIPGALEDGWQSTLPVRTDWVGHASRPASCDSTTPGQPGCLAGLVRGAAQLRAWLLLESPPAGSALAAGASPTSVGERRITGFAYELALRDDDSGAFVESLEACRDEDCDQEDATLWQGNRYQLVLRHVQPQFIRRNRQSERRYIYVFAIDRNGCGSLLYPFDLARSDPHVQQPCALGTCPGADPLREPEVIELWPAPEAIVEEPFGIESLFLLTSEQALSAPPQDLLEAPCLRSPETEQQRRIAQGADPLVRLLRNVGRRRGSEATAVGSWSLQVSRFRTAGAAQH